MDNSLTFWEHVEELRKTLIRVLLIMGGGVLVAFVFHKSLLRLLVETGPYALFSPLEGIGVIIKLSIWVGCVTTSPFWLYTILLFIAPALNEKQRKQMLPFLFFSLLFLFLGLCFAHFLTLPFATSYLWGLNQELGTNVWGLAHTLDFTLFLLLSNGLAFECCVILLFLVHYRVFTAEQMAAKRKVFIVAAFILSAFLTPPDVVTQILMALPLIALYECAILYAYLRTQTRSRLSCSSK